jgi:chromate transporter
MAQPAVSGFAGLSPSEMADGLGLAETPPDPLIMVAQCIGLLGAWRHPGCLSPLAIGLLSAGPTTWVTFAPCFLWIFACAPWMERLERAERLQGALAAITAAIGGLIANLALWFALHVLFRSVSVAGLPVLSSLDWRATVIAAGAALLLFPLKCGIMPTLALSAAAGLAFSAF